MQNFNLEDLDMTADRFDTFDFVINEEDEAMLLLYARENEPQNPRIELDIENKSAVLYRTPDEAIDLEDIPDEALDSMADADKLLVCELARQEDKDSDIVYAYEADID